MGGKKRSAESKKIPFRKRFKKNQFICCLTKLLFFFNLFLGLNLWKPKFEKRKGIYNNRALNDNLANYP